MGHSVLEGGETVFITLVRNVKNVQALRKKIISGELPCGLVKPSLLVDPFQIVVAANKANISLRSNKMTTKTIYTEILFNLSISKNISQSLVKFGVHDSDNDLVVVVVGNEDEFRNVLKQVDGEEVDVSSELSSLTNVSDIQKTYNIKDGETAVSSLLDSIVSRIAAKQCIN